MQLQESLFNDKLYPLEFCLVGMSNSYMCACKLEMTASLGGLISCYWWSQVHNYAFYMIIP